MKQEGAVSKAGEWKLRDTEMLPFFGTVLLFLSRIVPVTQLCPHFVLKIPAENKLVYIYGKPWTRSDPPGRWKSVGLRSHPGCAAALTPGRIPPADRVLVPSLQDPGGADRDARSDLQTPRRSW